MPTRRDILRRGPSAASGFIRLAVMACVVSGCEEEVPLPSTPPLTSPPVLIESDVPREKPHPEPPHGGVLFEVDREFGYVEWEKPTGRLYLLDREGQPTNAVERLTAHVAGDQGPEPVTLEPCPDAAGPGCYEASGEHATGLTGATIDVVVRFRAEGAWYRVRLISGLHVPPPGNGQLSSDPPPS